MGRPRLIRRDEGLTRREIAKQLGCSYSNVRRWHEEGLLPCHRDRDGNFRSSPRDVVEFARRVGRAVQSDGETVARIYEFFLAPGFKLTNESIARIVVETRQHPDLIIALWHKFNNAAPAPAPSRELQRVSEEYDEQIAAMEERFADRRANRGSFIPGDADDQAEPEHETRTKSGTVPKAEPTGPGVTKAAPPATSKTRKTG